MNNIEKFDRWFYKNHYAIYIKYWNEFNKFNLRGNEND